MHLSKMLLQARALDDRDIMCNHSSQFERTFVMSSLVLDCLNDNDVIFRGVRSIHCIQIGKSEALNGDETILKIETID